MAKKKPVKPVKPAKKPTPPAPPPINLTQDPVVPENAPPLERSVGPIRCIVTPGWFGGSTFTPKDGSRLPFTESAVEADVMFHPPQTDAPAPASENEP